MTINSYGASSKSRGPALNRNYSERLYESLYVDGLVRK